MQTLKDNINAFFVLICELLIGILLLIDHTNLLSIALKGAGAALILCGVSGVVRYLHAPVNVAVVQHTLGRGLMQIASGCVFLFGTSWLLTIFPLITVLCGAGFLLVGCMKVQQAADHIRLRLPCRKISVCNAALCLAAALLILLNPFAVSDTLWKFAAIAMIVSSAADLAALVIRNQKE